MNSAFRTSYQNYIRRVVIRIYLIISIYFASKLTCQIWLHNNTENAYLKANSKYHTAKRQMDTNVIS